MRSKSKVILFTVVLLFITFNSTAFTGEGSGTPTDPYMIENVEHLQSISQEPGAYYVLANDIDASARGFDRGFTPIKPFSGTLDGQGHEIENLKIIKKDGSPLNENEIGLFQSISENGKVKKLGMKNPEIKAAESGDNAGILAGIVRGNVSRFYVNDGLISIDNVYMDNVGGISGEFGENNQQASIRNSYVTGKIQGGSRAETIGGLTGELDDSPLQSKHMIENSYVGSYVTGGEKIGVLVGESTYGGEESLRLVESYYDRDLNPGTPAIGEGTYGGEGLTSSGITDRSNFKNWDFENIWKMGEEGPELRGITGEADNPPELPESRKNGAGGDGDDEGDSEGGSDDDSDSSDTITALRDTIDQLNSTVQSLRQENQELRAQLEQDSSGSEDSQKVSELEEENQQLKETNNQLKESNNQLEERVDELESQVDDSGGDSGSDSSGAFNDLLDLILR